MMHRDGRRNRWVSGFGLLALAICSLLPFGAIGAIDASFTSAVVVPHQRPTTQHNGRQVVDRTARDAHAQIAPPVRIESARPHLPALRRPVAPFDPLVLGLLLAVVVVFALAGTATNLPARTPLLARPPSRGPPFAC